MPAAAPAGGEAEVEEGFRILDTELRKNTSCLVKPLVGAMYFIGALGWTDEASVEFWCLLHLQSSRGNIAAQVYHPDGQDSAMEVMTQIHDVLCSCIHRTNQQLLLRR